MCVQRKEYGEIRVKAERKEILIEADNYNTQQHNTTQHNTKQHNISVRGSS
jgi:hypothetical protein